RHLQGQRRAPDRGGIRQRLHALGRVEDELDLAVLERVDDVGPALQHLVDPRHREAGGLQRLGRAAGGDQLEAHLGEGAGRGDGAGWGGGGAGARASSLWASLTEMNPVPATGRRRPAPTWLLAKARPKFSSIPITSPVERISGPSTASTPGKRLNGITASLTE